MTPRDEVGRLLDEHGRTFAAQAGIRLRDKPSPLFCLAVLTMLSSTRLSADVAAAAAAELFRSGWRTPAKMRSATWQQRVDALGRGGYRRYDESTASRLAELCEHVVDEYRGDLRRLKPDPGDRAGVDTLREAVAAFPRIGPTGSGIFVREVQAVWPEVGPFFDDKALRAARARGLPDDPARLAELAPRGRVADLAAALVRAG